MFTVKTMKGVGTKPSSTGWKEPLEEIKDEKFIDYIQKEQLYFVLIRQEFKNEAKPKAITYEEFYDFLTDRQPIDDLFKKQIINDDRRKLEMIEKIYEDEIQKINHLLLALCVELNSQKCFRFLLETYDFGKKTVNKTFSQIVKYGRLEMLAEMNANYPRNKIEMTELIEKTGNSGIEK